MATATVGFRGSFILAFLAVDEGGEVVQQKRIPAPCAVDDRPIRDWGQLGNAGSVALEVFHFSARQAALQGPGRA